LLNIIDNNAITQQTTPNMETKQTKGLNRNTIDKYYTNSNTVIKCLSIFKEEIKINDNDIIIEPSAGNGSFINDINKLNGLHKFYDIEPENELITKQDFSSVTSIRSQKKIVTSSFPVTWIFLTTQICHQ
jgi:hypothetical protein